MPESSVSTTPAAAPEAALAPPPPGRENLLSAAVRALRPKQWTKNAAVLAPLVFAHKALVPGLSSAKRGVLLGHVRAVGRGRVTVWRGRRRERHTSGATVSI